MAKVIIYNIWFNFSQTKIDAAIGTSPPFWLGTDAHLRLTEGEKLSHVLKYFLAHMEAKCSSVYALVLKILHYEAVFQLLLIEHHFLFTALKIYQKLNCKSITYKSLPERLS